ncbi:uncharacterized protein LOC131632299 [Vicia villosa]|uniref:uncharacterized protein LOC131632299 n=1 Tax=Vicia villosa TaxID=3911 RepID=UPI00273A9BC2|nr:uncharacterized protein LOC131632299 [Vicia villosa]
MEYHLVAATNATSNKLSRMSHQFCLDLNEDLNEDDSPIRDEGALRYSLASNPPSLVAFNNRIESVGAAESTQVVANISPFSRNNNLLSSGSGSSSSARGLGWGFNGFTNNNNTNTNLDLFDSIQPENDDTFIHRTINVQQNESIFSGDHVNQFITPTIVPVRSNSYVPQQPQSPSNLSTSSYHINPPPPPLGPEFNTPIEFDQYVQTDTSLTRPENRRRDHIDILTSHSIELRAQRNRLRNEIFSTLQHLHNGGSVRTEELLILDLSIVLNVLDSQENIDMLHNIDEENYVEEEIIRRLN